MVKQVKRETQDKSETSITDVSYLPVMKPRWGEKLVRNLSVAGMLVLTITAIRNEQLPSGNTVLTAVQEMIDTNWNENIGKISFVSNILPESVAVFFDTAPQGNLTAPCFGEINHLWNEKEPYIGYLSKDAKVYAAADGQVMSVSHGPDEERIIRIRQENGLETMYYNLSNTFVSEGNMVNPTVCIGEALPDREVILEVRRAGRAVDPTALLSPREKEPQ